MDALREEAIRALELCVEDIPDARVRAFGSTVSSFGDERSDLDLSIDIPLSRARGTPRALAQSLLLWLVERITQPEFCLPDHNCLSLVESAINARVPCVVVRYGQFSDGETLDCDVTVNNVLPVYNTELLREYAQFGGPAVVAFVREVKQWAKEKQLHGAAANEITLNFLLSAMAKCKHPKRSMASCALSF